MVFFFTNLIILSSLAHKEMRFITTLIQIGQIAQAYMVCWCFDCRDVMLEGLKIHGLGNTDLYRRFKWLSGFLIKYGALYVLVKQERARIIRYIYNNYYK